MLASITPLGERSRGFSWRITATAFAIGALAGGAAVGAAAGLIGSAVPDGRPWRYGAALLAAGLALAHDLLAAGSRPPGTRRQVDEDWLTRYRGWVYGLGFGVQLGGGVVTIVSSAATYAAFAACVLSGDVAAGAVIGTVFGAVRAAAILPAGRVHDWAGLQGLHRGLLRWQGAGRRAGIAIEVGAVVVLAVTA
ncbi:MAG: hypothetical protein QOG68_898 [Solirubrobacteraceae bacterium]|nr:hypothetical protein [Solirubrobacteraceae bacterium]